MPSGVSRGLLAGTFLCLALIGGSLAAQTLPKRSGIPRALRQRVRQREGQPGAALRLGATSFDAPLAAAEALISPVTLKAAPPAGFAGRTWKYIGPRNLDPPRREQYGPGPVSGRVSAIAYHSQKPDVFYLGSGAGGFWRSDDQGQNWTCLSNDWPNQTVSSIAVHPLNGEVVYVGTGDFAVENGKAGYGVMKTVDGGKTWERVGGGRFDGFAIRAILIDPDSHDTVTLITGRDEAGAGAVWQSRDGGKSWKRVLTQRADWSDLVCSIPRPGKPRYYYACGHAYNGGEVWRSGDQGRTWTQLTVPLRIDADTRGWQEGLDLATSATEPDTVYLLAALDQTIRKSTDAGEHWVDVTGDFPNGRAQAGDVPSNWHNSGYDFYIECGERDGWDVVYVGLVDLVMSPYGGNKWVSIGQGETIDTRFHIDQQCLALRRGDPNELLIGNDGGAYRLRYTPQSRQWEVVSLNATLEIGQFFHADYSLTSTPAGDPEWILGGAMDNAAPQRGPTGGWRSRALGDVDTCVVHPLKPETQYAATNDGHIYQTTDGWADPQNVSFPTDSAYEKIHQGGTVTEKRFGLDSRGWHIPIAVDPSQVNLLYAATNYLWRWDNSSGKWRRRLGGQLLAQGQDQYVTELLVTARRGGTRIVTGASTGEVWLSDDGGDTWKRIDVSANKSSNLPDREITCLALAPRNPDRLLVGVNATQGPRLWQCGNVRNPAWSAVSTNGLAPARVNSATFDPEPRTSKQIYLGTDAGVFISRNDGAAWFDATLPLGLPRVPVNHVRLLRKPQRGPEAPPIGHLMAATWGRGIWRLEVPVLAP